MTGSETAAASLAGETAADMTQAAKKGSLGMMTDHAEDVTQPSRRAQREDWAREHQAAMAALGLQAVFCVTRDRSPVPMAGSTGGAPFGVFVMPSKGHTRPAFRMPPNAVALDVDQKPGKADGTHSLLMAEVDLGFLPPTQRLTAHGFAQGSGRLLYRIPEGLCVDERFFGQYGGAIDVIRTGHRFSMAPGDVHHDTGTPVVCYNPDGSEGELLPVSAWPLLPVDWLLALDEWCETVRSFEPEERSLESVMSSKAAQATVISQLDKLATHDTSGSGFRSKLLSASVTLGGFVGSLYADEEAAIEALADAVSQLWGADADADDMQMITSGVAKGASAPWVVLAAEPEPERVAAAVEPLKLPPVVQTDVQQITEWLRAEVGRNGLSGLFLRAGQLVKVVEAPLKLAAASEVQQHDGFQQIAMINTPGQLRAYAQMCGYRFYTPGGKETPPKPALLNVTAASSCIDTTEGLPNAQTLKGVTGTPIIRGDGGILDTPGYDAHSQLLFKPDSPDLVVPWVSDRPGADEVTAARELLEYIVVDYKFVDDNHRANYLGALMLPLLRAIVPPPYKLLAIDAYAPGSGKTLLADVLRIVHHGRRGGTPGGSFRSEWPKREEFSKWVTSVLMNGAGGVVQVDNVKATLAGGELEGLLTNASYGGRVLGRSEEVHVPNDRLWVVTGNNIAIGGDMARRVLWVRIDPGLENPEQRRPEDFREPHLEEWAFANRGRIIHAVLTLARAWYVEGAQLAPATSSDSYARSISVVQGILKHAGITGTFDPMEDRARSQDEDDTATFLRLVHEWQDQRDDKFWLASELAGAINSDFDEGLRDAIPEHWWRGPTLSSQALGKRLDAIKGAYHHGQRLIPGALDRLNKRRWTIGS